jgi:hypothetical protein
MNAPAQALQAQVIVPEPRPTSDVPYHHDRAPGQKYLLLDQSVSPQSPIYVALRRVNYVPARQPRWLDPHAHLCNSFYIFLGDEDDFAGLHGEVEIGEDRFEVKSPSSVLIPPLVRHHYWLTSGSGWYLQITLSPTYEASLADEARWQPTQDPALRGRLYSAARRDGARLRLIDDALLPDPGLEVDLSSSPFLGTAGLTLHVAISPSAAPAAITFGDSRLVTPVAILTKRHDLLLEQAEGSPFVVRIRPAPERSRTGASAVAAPGTRAELP